MKRTHIFILTLLFIALMVIAGFLQSDYDSRRNYFAEQGTFVTLPNGKTLKVLSFGFQNLTADMLFIWSIQFYSSYHLNNRYLFLEHIFDTITDLNPTFKEPYMVGSWIMALEKGDVPMAIRLLEKGSRNMPDEWIFEHECGFYAYKELKDAALAEKYFERAAAKPGAPSHIARKRAHMIYMQDNLEYSYQLWLDILKTAGDDRFARSAARNHLHQIKFEMDKQNLEKLIREFKAKRGRFPFILEELVETHMIKQIPKDFGGDDYVYNAQSGTVTAHKVLKWKKSY